MLTDALVLTESISIKPVLAQHVWQNIIAEIVRTPLLVFIANQLFIKKLGVKDVVTHGREDATRFAGNFSGFGRFLLKAGNSPFVIDDDNAERVGGFFSAEFDAGNSRISAILLVRGQHWTVIHFVDVITTEHQHLIGFMGADNVNVLVHSIRGAGVPGVASTH